MGTILKAAKGGGGGKGNKGDKKGDKKNKKGKGGKKDTKKNIFSLIPWIILAIILIAIGYFVFKYFVLNKSEDGDDYYDDEYGDY